MTKEKQTPREYSNTYFVQDRERGNELARLTIQDHLLTEGMGGSLPEQSDPAQFQRILDVGCGTGSWLIEAAKTYPTISTLIGIDASPQMVTYANSQAEVQGVADRVTFQVMDATLLLEFPQGFFDLTNQRLGFSYLRTWDWPKLLQEYQRITRPRGIIRITEGDVYAETSSPALATLYKAGHDAFNHAGHTFSQGRKGVTAHLPELLQQHGYQNIHTRTVPLTFRSGSDFCEDMRIGLRGIVPFLQKWGTMPDSFEELYQQALQEMQDPSFFTSFELFTIWGTNPFRHS